MPLDYGVARQMPSQAYVEFVSTAPEGALFGFNATRLRIVNDRALPCYITLGTTVGTTAGVRTCASETLIDGVVPPCCAIGIASTTTSTGLVRVAAWG